MLQIGPTTYVMLRAQNYKINVWVGKSFLSSPFHYIILKKLENIYFRHLLILSLQAGEIAIFICGTACQSAG
jgi:hypothetical protein